MIKHPGKYRQLIDYKLTSQVQLRGLSYQIRADITNQSLQNSVRKKLKTTPKHLKNLTLGHTEHIFTSKSKKTPILKKLKKAKNSKVVRTKKKHNKVSRKTQKSIKVSQQSKKDKKSTKAKTASTNRKKKITKHGKKS